MFAFIKHWLTPHVSNNHRAKILHHSSLFAITILLLVVSFTFNALKTSHPEVLGISYSISENDLYAQVNSQRIANGLPALNMNSQLSDAARRKAADMMTKNYWAHFAPDGSTTPWQFIKASGYNYQFAGENLAKGFTDSGSVVSAWMNSPSHRENILSSKYKDVGYAIVPGVLQGEDTVLVVQMFGETPGEPVAVAPEVNVQPQQAEVPVIQEPVVEQPEVKSIVTETKQPVLDTKTTSKVLLWVVLSFIVFGLVMDMLIIERKRIPRIVGHNLDHIILISTFILFLLILKGGVVV